MKTYLIYLASGNSRRFGSNKLLYEYKGKALYRHTLERLSKSDYEIIVVSQYDEIIQELACDSRYKVVRSQDSYLGISYTIRYALMTLKNVKRPFQMVFVVADQPYLTLETVEHLIEESQKHHAFLASCFCEGKACNPTLFHSDYFDELMNLKDDQGGRVVLKKYHHDVLYVDFKDEKEFKDIDYKEDIKN